MACWGVQAQGVRLPCAQLRARLQRRPHLVLRALRDVGLPVGGVAAYETHSGSISTLTLLPPRAPLGEAQELEAQAEHQHEHQQQAPEQPLEQYAQPVEQHAQTSSTQQAGIRRDHAASRLTRDIGQCRDWQQLEELLEAHASRLNGKHVAAALCTAIKLSSGSSPAGGAAQAAPEPLVAGLCELAVEMAPRLGPREWCTCLWAAAKLSHRMPRQQARALLAAAQRLLPAFTARDLSLTAWALGQLHLAPSAAWRDAFLDAAARRMPSFSPQDLATFALGLSRMQAAAAGGSATAPPPSLPQRNQRAGADTPLWQSRLLAESQAKLQYCSPQSLATLIHALAVLGVAPPSAWMEALLQVSFLQLLHMRPQPLAMLLGGVAACGVTPAEPWMERCLAQAEAQLPQASAADLSNLLCALARLRFQPEAAWMSACLARLEALLPSASAQDVCMALWAVAKLGYKVPERLLAACLAPGTSLWTSELKEADVAMATWAFAVLRFKPGQAALRFKPDQDWLDFCVGSRHAALAHYSAHSLMLLPWSLARLGYRPPPAWLDAYCTATQRLLPGLSSRDVCSLTSSAVKLGWGTEGYQLPAEWLGDLLVAAAAAVPYLPPDKLTKTALRLMQLCNLAHAAGNSPPPATVAALQAALAPWLDASPPASTPANQLRADLERLMAEAAVQTTAEVQEHRIWSNG